jgi:hypothetical protein
MFGWIETGGFFTHTASNDIVFRTVSANQFIAIGNSDSQNTIAAMYVLNNCIGINSIPDSDFNLKVDGTSLFMRDLTCSNQITNSQIINNGNQLRFTGTSNIESAIVLDTFDSRLQAQTILTSNIVTKKILLTNVLVKNITMVQFQDTLDDPIVYGADIDIDASLAENFNDGIMIVINNRTFIVWSVNQNASNVTLRLSNYSSFAPIGSIVFGINDVIDIVVLESWNQGNASVAQETLYYRFVIDSFTYTDVNANGLSQPPEVFTSKAILQLNVFFRNKTHVLRENVRIGDLYCISDKLSYLKGMPSVILELTDYNTYTTSSGLLAYSMTFTKNTEYVDLNALLGSIIGVSKTIVVFPLTFLKAPMIQDDNVTVGYSIDAIARRMSYLLTSTRLTHLTSASGFNYGIKSIRLGDRPLKSIAKYYMLTNESVVIDTFAVTDTMFNVARQTVVIDFNGIPICIEAATRISDVLAEMTISIQPDMAYMLENLAEYVGNYLTWVDKSSFIVQLNQLVYDDINGVYHIGITNNSQQWPVSFFQSNPRRIVYVMPFKFTTHLRLGEVPFSTFVPTSLSIGTIQTNAKLNVDGNASFVNDIVLCNSKRSASNLRDNMFIMNYSDSRLFNMNNVLTISASNINVAGDGMFSGDLLATNYNTFSDRRLKENIQDTSIKDDLDRILQIDVKTFNFKYSTCGTAKKGVIAQELQRIYPDAVKSKRDVYPLCEPDTVYNCIDNQINFNSDTMVEAAVGDSLRISTHGCLIETKITKIIQRQTLFGYTCFIEVDKKIQPESFIIGVVSDILTVNYEYLYLSSINAIKQLANDILKMKVQNLEIR